MATNVIMPALGMAQDTGKVLRWLRSEGDPVTKGEPLLEIETDKVTVDVEAPADGTLAGVRAQEGDEIPVGEVVAVVLGAGETAPEPEAGATREAEAVAAAPSADGGGAHPRAPARSQKLASPKARRIARQRGVAIESVAGSGPRGAVVAADVERLARPTETEARRLPSVWRVMADRTTQSWQAVPHFYLRREVDATRLLSWHAVARKRPDSERVSLTDLLVKVAAESLRRHPRVNGSWREGTLVESGRINVAVAVAIEDGLVAPVIHDADGLDLPDLVARRERLVDAARTGRLRLDDVSDGTFTISNLGMYGVDEFDAIVNAPQAAILAVGRIAERLVAADGGAAVRPTLKLTLSLDHRAVDGARGAEFLDTLASLLEEPAGLVR